jgi:hypothetical protein
MSVGSGGNFQRCSSQSVSAVRWRALASVSEHREDREPAPCEVVVSEANDGSSERALTVDEKRSERTRASIAIGWGGLWLAVVWVE